MKIKFADFRIATRARSCPEPIASAETIERIALELLGPFFPPPRGIRLLGVTLSNFDGEPARQLALSLVATRHP